MSAYCSNQGKKLTWIKNRTETEDGT